MYKNKSLLIWIMVYQNVGTSFVAIEINGRVIRHCCCQLIAQLENHNFFSLWLPIVQYDMGIWYLNRTAKWIQFGTKIPSKRASICCGSFPYQATLWEDEMKDHCDFVTRTLPPQAWIQTQIQIHDVYDDIYDDDRQKSDVKQIRP